MISEGSGRWTSRLRSQPRLELYLDVQLALRFRERSEFGRGQAWKGRIGWLFLPMSYRLTGRIL